MNGVLFFLTVNWVVALCFSALFAVVSTRSRSRTAALWLAAGFGIASLSAVFELLVAYTSFLKISALGAFTSVVAGMALLRVGVGELYGRPLDKRVGIVFVVVTTIGSHLIYDLPRSSALHAVLYQTPFALAVLSSARAVLLSRRRLVVDRFLGALMFVTGLHFIAKAGLTVLVGSGTTAKDYIHTDYALISQSATAVLMVAVGLSLLAVLVLEIMADHQSESEKDALSELANRRGFDRRVGSLLKESKAGPHAVIICDLDHFKSINDTYGHHIGDLVIQSFGELLRNYAPATSATGRIGGEEFAVFLPSTPLDTALSLAQTLRKATTTIEGLPLRPTASFGVASLSAASDLQDAYRRADKALYEAKNSGRDRVKLAMSHA
ncbi:MULTISPECIES: GGDEF domain-containing protein [Agrobacterium]|jgi:diguanylate cyclase (GGDEF)-like protein|uniref:GGDEF domain-containing protein n=1 Tax=Agrobacterium TaxID=357 RepID=UPI000DDB42AE|nr:MULTISPECIES: GGDEF domain-containing protein [Agrobacterium]UHS58243.1 GGDEF domain-containing protein [Agrobacterium vaccinii]